MRTLILVVLGIVVLSAAATFRSELVVSGEDGQVLWRLPVHSGARVTLLYTNSIYNARTEERFRVRSRSLVLETVASESEAVLAYNGLSGPYKKEGALVAAGIKRVFPSLVLRVGQTGRQQLAVGTSMVPLYTAGTGTQLRVEILRGWRLLR